MVRASGAADESSPGAAAELTELLAEARAWEQIGYVTEAREAYERVIRIAVVQHLSNVLAEALRRRAVLAHQAGESAVAAAGLQQSYAVAHAAGDLLRAAEALNALGGLRIETGQLEQARAVLEEAAALAADAPPLRARVAQNLGVVATIRGDHSSATRHYEEALVAYEGLGDAHGVATARHNLGMLAADAAMWVEADAHFTACLNLAWSAGDPHLEALCRVNRAEVQLARGEVAEARAGVEAARRIVDKIGKRSDLPDIERVLAHCDRAEGHLDQAETRLQRARALAAELDAPLTAAEAADELGDLCRELCREGEARSWYEMALRAFTALGAERNAARTRAALATLEPDGR